MEKVFVVRMYAWFVLSESEREKEKAKSFFHASAVLPLSRSVSVVDFGAFIGSERKRMEKFFGHRRFVVVVREPKHDNDAATNLIKISA